SGISTLASGGSIAEALQQTAFTFATAAVWHGVGDMLGEDPVSVAAGNEAKIPTRIAVHGLVGGGIQAAEGGNFADGFLSAAAAEATPLNEIGTDFSKTSVVAERTIAAGIVGGTVASATGGSFMNGAKTAAYAEMFNSVAHDLENFMAGMGDALTIDAGEHLREATGITEGIDKNSVMYRYGHALGSLGLVFGIGEAGDESTIEAFNNEKGLGNPFKGKNAGEIDQMFRAKGYEMRGNNPVNGEGGYVNPYTGRSYHIDPIDFGRYREPNHVDVNRDNYDGPLNKRKYFY
ncbi:MAG: hypothetical protein KKE46_00505, partial [Gammaproteobacteria bacterium]|nr:hypothetical protein [Gammaproteobacteria bacterium]